MTGKGDREANSQQVLPPGETRLSHLLVGLSPELDSEVYVFAQVLPHQLAQLVLSPLGQFQEAEGVTVVLTQAEAEAAQLPHAYPCRHITLTVQSNLAAVGLLAAVTQALAAAGISVNAMSAYAHDHLFVPCDRADAAIAVLTALSEAAR